MPKQEQRYEYTKEEIEEEKRRHRGKTAVEVRPQAVSHISIVKGSFRPQEPKIPKIQFVSSIFNFEREVLETKYNTQVKLIKVPKLRLLPKSLIFLESDIDETVYSTQRSTHIKPPKLEFRDFVANFTSENLNYTIKDLKRELATPHVIFPKHKIDIRDESLDSKMFLGTKSALIIPKIKFKESYQAFAQESLDTSTTHVAVTETGERTSRVEESKEIELPRTPIKPLEFLFGGGAGALKDAPEPLIILFKDPQDDSYIHLFEEILIRIYREKKGGIPDIKKLTLKDEWSKREVERWLDEGKIFVVDIDSEGEINKELLADRLWAIFHGRKGIVIFYTKDEKVSEKYRRLLEEVNWQLQRVAKIVEITPRKLSFKEKKMLTKLILGNIIVKDVAPGIDQDTIFNETSKLYEDKLEKLVNEYYHTLGIIREGENESKDHLRMKAFIVSTLIKELVKRGIKDIGEILERIRTEEPFGTIVPDVIFEDEFYEAETLFEEGFHKIHKTIQKYSGIPGRVKIVVEPITAFIHADDFLKLLKILKKRYPRIDVSFYTMDLRNMELLDLRKYLKELSEFLSSNPNTS
ncbi:hypothetical protein [Pyrococcus kukulkanii]|uniref:DUF835 domain-containing protein n=1 Tax=Pyrococcus kukulkanii TaxID=1609559 RepID=A0ABV4T4N7_9EURY